MDKSDNQATAEERSRDSRMNSETSVENQPVSSHTEDRGEPAVSPHNTKRTIKDWLCSGIKKFTQSLFSPLGLVLLCTLFYAVVRFKAILELSQKMLTNVATQVAAVLEFIQDALTDAQKGEYNRLWALMMVMVILLVIIIAVGEEIIRRYKQTPWIPIYGSLRSTQNLDLRSYESSLRSISDVTSSNGTGYIYVSGNVGGSKNCVLIVQLNSLIRVTNCFTTDVSSGQLSFISISPKEELIVTSTSCNKISVLNDRGRLLKSVETGSRCGRCVSDGQSLYVCHPDRHCVTVLDDKGRKLLVIGDEELKLPTFLAMDQTHRLYVSDERTKSLQVYGVFSSGSWLGNCWRWIEAFVRRDTPLRQLQAEWVRQICGSKRGRETSISPQGVCVDPKGTLLLSDRSEKCVKIYNKKGHVLQKLHSPQISNPLGLTYNVTGDAVILVDQASPASLIIFSQWSGIEEK